MNQTTFAPLEPTFRPEETTDISRDAWQTPPEFYDPTHRFFGFAQDVCTDGESNTRCENYISKGSDALNCDWGVLPAGEPEFIYANVPYSEVNKWCYKAIEQARRGKFTFVLMHSRFGVEPFREIYRDCLMAIFFMGRIQFIPPPGTPATTNNRDAMALIFGPGDTDFHCKNAVVDWAGDWNAMFEEIQNAAGILGSPLRSYLRSVDDNKGQWEVEE